MVLVLCTMFAYRARSIEASLPYWGHVDERTWSDIAFRMLRTGDPNPHRFRKPSLGVYLMATGFGVGIVKGRLSGTVAPKQDLGTHGRAYYTAPSVAVVARWLFALMSVLAAGAAGVLGYAVLQRPAALWLVPLFASVSGRYFWLSFFYMNVDVPGALFTLATLAYVVASQRRDEALGRPFGGPRRAVVAGILGGLAVGSKYNLFPILLPCALWFVLFERERFFRRWLVLGFVAVATFFLTTPYALLDYRTFLRDMLVEMHHYATGHPRQSISPGLPMLWRYIDSFLFDFGWLPLCLSVGGGALIFRRDWRLALVVFAFPVVFLVYMGFQHVFFVRNALGVELFIALGLAALVLELPGRLSRVLERLQRPLPPQLVRLGPHVVAVLLVVLGIPWARVALAYSRDVQPRRMASDWIVAHVKPGTRVLIDSGLNMDPRPLQARFRVSQGELDRQGKRMRRLAAKKRAFVVVTSERTVAAYEKVLPRAKKRITFRHDWTAYRHAPVVVISP